MSRKRSVAPGCYFEPDESEVLKDPIVGKKSGTISEEPEMYRRKSVLDDVPDDFAARMMGRGITGSLERHREVNTPEGFSVAIAYNKSRYPFIPKEDLKNA